MNQRTILTVHLSHTGDSLRVTKYHGQTRQRELDVLKDSDLVITTYNTLATEVAAKKSLLHKLYWYRVVLDEGMNSQLLRDRSG